jgi:hypothetical protein
MAELGTGPGVELVTLRQRPDQGEAVALLHCDRLDGHLECFVFGLDGAGGPFDELADATV